jgi:threonine/homoserine/homoserine lactone efflux protein
MIDPQLYFAFIVATSLLMLIPGPNVALIVANSVAHGSRYGLVTVLGTSSAMVVQLGLTALGMVTALGRLALWFDWLRWLGVAYLIFLGIQQWRAPKVDLTATRAQPRSLAAIYLRGFLVSLTNPKTLVFYGAFFPQFLTPGARASAQLAVLSCTFLGLAAFFDLGWALLSGRARRFLAAHAELRNRLSGGILLGAAVGLAVARRK